MPFAKTKRKQLLRDANVRRWHDNVGRGAQVTADVYLRRLRVFCENTKISPRQLSSLSETGIRNLLLDFVTSEEKLGRAPSYINSSVKSVKSWLAFNGRALTIPIRVRDADSAPTLRDERVPSPDELRRLLQSADSRERVACVLMAHSGVRPQVLGNYSGTDGVRLGDLSGLILKEGGLTFERTPTFLTVRSELSKLGRSYLTPVSSEACDYILTYLTERAAAGERLSDSTDLIHPVKAKKSFLTAINVGDMVRTVFRRAGFRARPYVLRAYFDTRALLAESEGKLAHDYRVFWMGHKGSVDARYTTNKGRLPEDLLQDMLRSAGRLEPYLTTERRDSVERLRGEFKEMLSTALSAAGFSQEDIEEIERLPDGDLQKAIESRKTHREADHERMQRTLPTERESTRQRIVSVAEAEQLLAEGWQVVTGAGERLVMRAANS